MVAMALHSMFQDWTVCGCTGSKSAGGMHEAEKHSLTKSSDQKGVQSAMVRSYGSTAVAQSCPARDKIWRPAAQKRCKVPAGASSPGSHWVQVIAHWKIKGVSAVICERGRRAHLNRRVVGVAGDGPNGVEVRRVAVDAGAGVGNRPV